MGVVKRDMVNLWAGPEEAVDRMAVSAVEYLTGLYSCYMTSPIDVRVYSPIEARTLMGQQDPGHGMQITEHLTEHPEHFMVAAGVDLRGMDN